jgi:hypothetical protein
MLNLYIDFEIFVDFIKRQPLGGIIQSNIEEIDRWNSLWKFLLNGCNLTILNFPELNDNNCNNIEFQFLKQLSLNRGISNFNTNNFKKPFKHTFDLKAHYQSIYFLKEEDINERLKFVSKNPIPIAFQDGYLDLFNKLSLGDNSSVVIPVGKTEGDFISWDILFNYFHFVTDIVIADNYILDDRSIIESNFFEILKKFNAINNVFNLTIVTFEKSENKKLDHSKEVEFIRDKLIELNISCRIHLILLNRELKEHDRGIFTNFLRLKSGDSFNFLNSNGQIITKGTELDFYPLTNYKLFDVNKIALSSIKKKILKSKVKESDLVHNRLFKS